MWLQESKCIIYKDAEARKFGCAAYPSSTRLEAIGNRNLASALDDEMEGVSAK